jgi:hypothetical protein
VLLLEVLAALRVEIDDGERDAARSEHLDDGPTPPNARRIVKNWPAGDRSKASLKPTVVTVIVVI